MEEEGTAGVVVRVPDAVTVSGLVGPVVPCSDSTLNRSTAWDELAPGTEDFLVRVSPC